LNIELINLIKDPGTNLYMLNEEGKTIVSVLVQRTHTQFYAAISLIRQNIPGYNIQQVTDAMLDCWVALVGRPDYDSSQEVEFLEGDLVDNCLTYVVGDMQAMINEHVRKELDPNNKETVFNEVWDKYMTIVNRSVETTGKNVNKVEIYGDALSQAISKCSYFGSESWWDVTSTKMVEDMGKLPLSNIATTHTHDLRCFSVVAALLNAKGIDADPLGGWGRQPLYQACRYEFKWPIVVHLLDMLKDEPNNRLNYQINGETAFQRAVQHSPGAVIALIKQPNLVPNLMKDWIGGVYSTFEAYKMKYDDTNGSAQVKKNMVKAALQHVGAITDDVVGRVRAREVVIKHLESYKATPFQWLA
jgi:hypothetical protein